VIPVEPGFDTVVARFPPSLLQLFRADPVQVKNLHDSPMVGDIEIEADLSWRTPGE
jgi:hypothetical protein